MPKTTRSKNCQAISQWITQILQSILSMWKCQPGFAMKYTVHVNIIHHEHQGENDISSLYWQVLMRKWPKACSHQNLKENYFTSVLCAIVHICLPVRIKNSSWEDKMTYFNSNIPFLISLFPLRIGLGIEQTTKNYLLIKKKSTLYWENNYRSYLENINW